MKRPLGFLLAVAFLTIAAGTALAGGTHVLTFTDDGAQNGDRLGHAVAVLGDVDGDGYSDYIAGAYYGNGSRVGYVRVYSGRTGKVLYTKSGDSNYDGFGVSVNDAGDVNADGYADFVVGAHLGDTGGTDSGMARVFSGKDGSTLYTFKGDGANDRLGITVHGAGDVDKDGYDDIIAGAYYTANGTRPGYAKVLSGRNGNLIWKFTGKSNKDYYGVYVNGAGDVDQDGYADLIIGASLDDTSYTDAGRAEVRSGKTGEVLYSFNGPRTSANFARAVAPADVNQDGYPDFIIGAYLDDSKGTDSGTVFVYSGKDGKVLYTWKGDKSDDRIGVDVDNAGDVNNDGYPDVIAGAYYGDGSPGTNCGYARVFSGKDGSIIYTWYGEAGSDIYGRFAAGGGDMNGDGYGDLVVSAYAHNSEKGKIYVYISPVPSGTVGINDGAPATNDPDVTLDLAWQKAPTGDAVAEMRIRNAGEAWTNWMSLASSQSWTLPAGDQVKTVEAQYRDTGGAPSIPATATIFLDQAAPTGTVSINVGAATTSARLVSLFCEYEDVGIGVESMRFRNDGGTWSNWSDASATMTWTLTSGSGTKTVEAEFRDGAGNVSDAALDTIEYQADVQPPVVDTVIVERGRPYVSHGETMELGVYARDEGEAGLDAFKISYDGGDTWSEWYSLDFGAQVVVPRPDMDGLVTALIVVRDKDLNESPAKETAFYFLESEYPSLGSGGKFAGELPRREDVDALELRLVEGDALTVKLKGKAAEKKRKLEIDLELLGPDGESVFDGRYPADAKKMGVSGLPIPATGDYVLVAYWNAFSTSDRGTYSLAAKVKQAKENKKGKGSFTGTEILFDAAGGSTFKANLKGDGIAPETVSLEGPDGPVAIATKGKTGKVSIGSVVLDAGSGTYAIRFESAVTVSAKWSVKPGKVKGKVTE